MFSPETLSVVSSVCKVRVSSVDLRCSQSSFSLFFSQPAAAAAAACIRFLLSGYGGVAVAALRVSFLQQLLSKATMLVAAGRQVLYYIYREQKTKEYHSASLVILLDDR
jgi:hypothetical protein